MICAEDKWILSKVNTVIRDVTENMDKYELGIAVQKVYDFLWDELCDWYIEMAKVSLWRQRKTQQSQRCTLDIKNGADRGLKLLHPYHAVYHRRNLLHIYFRKKSPL